jgi:DNA repair protein RadD
MSHAQRANIFKAFRTGDIRVLCSVDTITTGFDLPALDCIVCLRPTLSSSLWVQIQGRGTRLFEGKKNCLLLDYVGNLQRLGGVDVIETFVREKGGEASEPIPAIPEPRNRTTRRVLPGVKTLLPIDPMTGQQATDGSTLEVQVHAVGAVAIPTRRNPNAPVLLVQYTCTTAENARIDATLFVTTERPTAADWQFFKRRNLAVNLPSPARQLLWQVRGAQTPNTVKVQKRGRYWNVVAESFPGDSN